MNVPEDDRSKQDLQQHQAEQYPPPHASSRSRLVQELIRLSTGELISNGSRSGRTECTDRESAPLELIKLSSNLIMFLFDKVALPPQVFTFDSCLARLDS